MLHFQKLDVYQCSIDFLALAHRIRERLPNTQCGTRTWPINLPGALNVTRSVSDARHELHVSEAYAAYGDYAQADEHAYTAVKLDPNLTDARVQLGQLLLSSGNGPAALAQFSAASQLEPGSEVVWLMCARAAISMRDYRRAIASLEEARKINAHHREVLRDLAWTYASVSEHAAAIRTFQQYFADGYFDRDSVRKLNQLTKHLQ